MAKSILSQEFVFSALDAEKSGTEFPIDFDDVWETSGYGRKEEALRALSRMSGLKKGIHYSANRRKSPTGGRPSESLGFTIDGYKFFLTKSNTDAGDNNLWKLIEIEKAYLAQLERQLLSSVVAPAPVTKPSKKTKALEADIANLQKKNDEYREDIKVLFEESELLKNNICHKTDFDLSIDDIINCLNPLPTSDYSAKRYWIEGIVFNDGTHGVDWVCTSLGVRVNYRFLIELAIFYRGVVGISFENLPDTLILEKARIFKNTQNLVNTRYPNSQIGK